MDNNSTSIGKDTMNKMSRIQRSGSAQARIIYKLHDRSQIYMDSAFRFMHPYSAHVCIVLGDRALESMLLALYIKESNFISIPHSLSLNDVIRLTAGESWPDLDTVMFIQSIQFLASFKDISLIQQIQTAHLKKLLKRVDDIITHLSPRITTHKSGAYRSIFSK